jgi:DNA-binding NarL/FixJ family response regulator
MTHEEITIAVCAMPISIAIVEDDAGIRSNLTDIVSRSPDCRLLATFPNAETALEDLPAQKPQVVLMDINLPGKSGIECVQELKAKLPETQFIILTVYEDSEWLFKALVAGATGYLLKRTPPTKIIEAIREAFAGGSPLTPQIARRVVQHFSQPRKPLPEVEKLSPREMEILQQFAKGYRYKEIVDNLGISMDTIRTHVRNMFEKLHVHSRTEAVVKYLNR